MGITMIVTGRLGKPERPSFFIPKGALTHHLRSRRWYPSLQSGRALFTKHPQDASPEGADNAAAFPCRHCLCGWQTAFALFAPSLQTVVLCRDNLPPACGKPATGSFPAAMDDALPAPSIFFCRAKRNKTAPCRGQKGRERLWRSIIWKQRS